MQVIFFSGTIVDSWDITWASIPPLASVVCEQGGPTGTVEGRTRGDFRRLQAVHSAGLLAGEVGLVSVREDSASRATQRELVGNAMFSAEEIGIKTARIAYVSETQYMKDFLNSMDVDGIVCRAHISVSWSRFYRVNSRVYVMTMRLRRVSHAQRLDT